MALSSYHRTASLGTCTDLGRLSRRPSVGSSRALARLRTLHGPESAQSSSTVVLVSGVLGSIAGGVLADLCQRAGGARRTIAALSVLTLLSAPTGLFAIAPSVVSCTLLLVSFMTSLRAMLVVAVVLLIVALPNELRGMCLSASAAANVLFGIGCSPILVSLLAGSLGGSGRIGEALSLVCVASCVGSAILFTVGVRSFPRQGASPKSDFRVGDGP